MNSHLRSVGKFFLGWVIVMLAPCLALVSGCSSTPKGPANVAKDRPTEYSLKSDRDQLRELRENVPAETQGHNDELAFILNMFQESKEQPYHVREKWNREVHRRRDRFDEQLRKSRDSFTKDERKKREGFLKDIARERENYNGKKHTSEERTEFYGELDTKRRDYFANERETREEFESNNREKRKDFDDYLREKQGEFDQAYREYQKKYDEAQKAAREKYEHKLMKEAHDRMLPVGSSPSDDEGPAPRPASGAARPQQQGSQKKAQDELKEFDQIPKGGTPLGPVDDGN